MLCRHLRTPIGEVMDMSVEQFNVFFAAMISVVEAEAPR